MSYNRSSSSSSGRRPSSERSNDPYYSDRDYRPSSRSSAPSSRSGTSSYRSEPSPYRSSSPRSGDGRSGTATKSPPPRTSSSRPSSSRPSGSKASSPNRGNSGRPSTKRRKKKRSPFVVILPLVLIIATISIVVVALNHFVFNGDKGKDSGDYRLEFSAQTMVVGGTATVKVVGLPENFDGKITWSSSDNEAVRVNDGVLTAKKVSQAVTISASVNGKNVPGTVKVIETVQGIKSLTITPDNLSLVSGKTFQLECKPVFEQTDPPAVTPTWSSSNSAVVSVSKDGLVTARDVGSASITATIGNQSATCAITVDKNPDSQPAGSEEGTAPETPDANAGTTGGGTTTTTPPATNGGTNTGTNTGGNSAGGSTNAGNTTTKPTVTGLSISQTEGQLDVGGTLVLEAYVLPSGGTVKWTSSSNSIATVSANGLVTGKGAGTATITAKVGSFSKSCKIIVSAPSPDVPDEEAPAQ